LESWRFAVSEKEKDGSVKRILPKGESERNSFQKETSHFIIEIGVCETPQTA
jgi:hypothetical protein